MTWQLLHRKSDLICYSCVDCGHTMFATPSMVKRILASGFFTECEICHKLNVKKIAPGDGAINTDRDQIKD